MRRLLAEDRGSILPLVAVILVPLLALLGGGVDITRGYLANNRMQEACDAGVYGALKKLSSSNTAGALPSDAATVGNTMFRSNFRDGDYGATGTTFTMVIDADKNVDGTASASVPTMVMKIFGQEQVDITATCTAKIPEPTGKNIDVMFVLENTASIGLNYDGTTKISAIRNALSFMHSKLNSGKQPGSRLRFGFVPFSGNVNVAFLLKDEWIKKQDYYQSRQKVYYLIDGSSLATTYANFTYISGAMSESVISTYAATWVEGSVMNFSCPNALPADSITETKTVLSTTTESVTAPTGTKTTKRTRRVLNGAKHRVQRDGVLCQVYRADYGNYIEEYDEITQPTINWGGRWLYDKFLLDISDWRATSNGCIKERDTYEISNYNAVDFTRAIDLDIDRVPDSESSKWSLANTNLINQRANTDSGGTSWNINPINTNAVQPYYVPTPISNCPKPARKLAEMTSSQLSSYLNSLTTTGNYSYPDVGMIWGARLLSPTGIFADENADSSGSTTTRHLIYLHDGAASTNISAVSAYGSEWLDRLRRHPTTPVGGYTLNTVVNERLKVACLEAKKRGITVWAISYGAAITAYPRDCVGTGYWFAPSTQSAFYDAITAIADSILTN